MFISQERDVRSKLIESIQKYGIKQVDVARETGKILVTIKESIIQHYHYGCKVNQKETVLRLTIR